MFYEGFNLNFFFYQSKRYFMTLNYQRLIKEANSFVFLCSFQKQLKFTISILCCLCYANFSIAQNEKAPVEIEVNTLRDWLINAPEDNLVEPPTKFILVDLPLSASQTASFAAFETNILSASLKKRFPEIKTYNIRSMDGAYSGKITISDKGVDGSIFGEGERVMIESTEEGSNTHLVYETVSTIHQTHNEGGDIFFDNDYENRVGSHRHTETEDFHTHQIGLPQSNARTLPIETNLRTIRAWIIADGEYSAAVDTDGLVDEATVLAAITAAMTSITAIYERDLGVKLILAGTTIYTDANTDIFPNAHTGNGFATQALQAFEDLVITNGTIDINSFDVGHVFSGNGGGGSGYIGVVCRSNINTSYGSFSVGKGGGGSALGNPVGASWVDLVAHELGHQFNALHTWSGQDGFCTAGQFSSNASVEPGSGTTLMSYSGSCSSDNVPNVGNGSYFHIFSIEEIDDYLNSPSGNCEGLEVTNNSAPVIDLTACTNLNIPIGTPFELTGSSTDPNGGDLNYIWEQVDLAPAQIDADQQANSITSPVFRSFAPTASPSRQFPQASDLITNNYNTNNAGVGFTWNGELLPTVARPMKFKFTVKDGSGGIATQQMTINTIGASSADYFTMSAPNGGEVLNAGSSTTITWNVNGTNAGSINCNSVDILLSTDGGLSFPITLVSGTANDGTETFTLPAGLPNSSTARIKVSCGTDCIRFFDISNADFTLSSACIAQTSMLCPTISTTAETGNAALNLTTSPLFEGISSASLNHTIDNSSPTAPRGYATTQNGTTCTDGNNRSYKRYDFTVDATGTYSFSSSFNIFNLTSIFLKSGFDPSDPCSGTFVGSNAYPNGGFINVFSPVEVSLVACTEYVLMVYANPTTTESLSISGPGNWIQFSDQALNTNYTYIAINQSTNTVVAQNSTANFTTLSGGITYKIYGVSYNNSETPSNWVGLTQSTLIDGSRCLLLSSNWSTLTVTAPPCSNPTPSLGTVTNPTTVGGTEGSIQLTGLIANTGYTLNYKKDNADAPAVPFTSDNSGNYILANLGAGVYAAINVTISTCTSSNLPTTTLSDPSATATCENDLLNVDTSIDNETYTCDTVSSVEVIPSNITVIYEGCKEVILKPGFEYAPTGSATFTARINSGSCGSLTSPDNSFNQSRINTQNTVIPATIAMAIHPNPSRDFVTIDYQLKEATTMSIGLFDLTGKQISRIAPQQAKDKGIYQQEVALGGFNAGMYFIVLQTEKEQISKKMILLQ